MTIDLRSLTPSAIANPCAQDWAAMQGTGEVRTCAHCSKQVHNLSEFGRAQAEEFLRQRDHRACIRVRFRPDGNVVTRDDAPEPAHVSRAPARSRLPRWLLRAASSLALAGLLPGCDEDTSGPGGEDLPPETPQDQRELMGEVCLPQDLPPPPPSAPPQGS